VFVPHIKLLTWKAISQEIVQNVFFLSERDDYFAGKWMFYISRQI